MWPLKNSVSVAFCISYSELRRCAHLLGSLLPAQLDHRTLDSFGLFASSREASEAANEEDQTPFLALSLRPALPSWGSKSPPLQDGE